MATELICGEFKYKKKTYPFVINERILTVIQSGVAHKTDFEEEEIGNLKGTTNKGLHITLIGCRRLGGASYLLLENIRIALKGYILHYERTCRYDRLIFQSPALNGFYSPRKAWTFKTEKPGRPKIIEMNEPVEVNQKFSCNIRGEKLDCILGFSHSFFLKLEETQPLIIEPVFVMDFQKTKYPTQIGKHYLYLRDFLVFLNFRTDIPINDIALFCKNKSGKLEKCGTATIFQHSSERYKPNSKDSITFDDLEIDDLAKLFSVVSGRRKSVNFNPYIFPEDDQDECEIDRAKWLITAISFEGEFDKSFPNYKYKTDKQFKLAKDLLLKTIETAVNQSGKGINNSDNAALKSFRHLVNTSDTTIQEKFAHCEKLFVCEMENKIKRICNESDIPFQQSFAENYATTRNNTAHGTIQPIENIDFVTYRMLRCFIYLLIMRRANVPSEKMKRIVEKLF